MGLSPNSTLGIYNGGQFISASYFDIANNAGTGQLTVDGLGSLYQTQGAITTDWGGNSGVAMINLTNNALASLAALRIGTSNARTTINVASDALLTANTYLAGEPTPGLSGAATINLVGGGMTCSGTASFRKASLVNVAGGSAIFGNDATFSTGATLNWSAGTWNSASFRRLAFDGGAASFTVVNGTTDSGKGLSNGATLQITANGAVATNSYFDIGNSSTGGATGTMLVDGALFLSTATPASGLYTSWGANTGNAATITFQNSAMGTYRAGLQIGANGGAATVNVATSAALSAASFNVGTSGTSGGVNLTINNAALSVTTDAALKNGALVNYASGTFNIGGQLTMLGNAQVLMSTGANKALRAGSLSLSGTSKIDLSDNAMIVDYTGASPLGTIGVWVNAGCANGSWTGNRLTSSSAAAQAGASHKTALGFAEASAIGLGAGSIFFGQTLADSTAVLVRYTYAGDGNVDGTVDLTDFTFLASNFNGTGKTWLQGDYNYDGTVNLTDFTFLASNFNQTLPVASAGLGATVPEPSVIALLVLAPLMAQRRRRD
jgi:hypothetical protein